jgi:hypothetical protein
MGIMQNASPAAADKLGRVVFSCRDSEYTIQDVMDFGWFMGIMGAICAELRIAQAREAEADQQGLEVNISEITTAADEFRYERDLLTAEEAEQWLADHDISQEQFSAFFTRRYWLAQVDEPAEVHIVLPSFGDSDYMELLRAEFILSGEFDRVATGMSWRIAANADRAGTLPVTTEAVDTQLQKLYERIGVTPPTLDGALQGIGHDRSWLDTLLKIEAVYQDCRRTVISEHHRQRALPSLRLGLIRVEFESTTAPNLDAAREAALCLSEEEMTIDELSCVPGSEASSSLTFATKAPRSRASSRESSQTSLTMKSEREWMNDCSAPISKN